MSKETKDEKRQFDEKKPDSIQLLKDLLEQAHIQTKLLSEIQKGVDLDNCLLEKIGQLICLIANESHRQTEMHSTIRRIIESFFDIYKSAHPEQALQLEKTEKLRAELLKCCPPDDKTEKICDFEPCRPHGGIAIGSGYSTKSKGFIRPVQISDKPHQPWKIVPYITNEADEGLPTVPQGPITGQIIPSAPTPQVLDFFSGGSPSAGPEEPVTFRTFSKTGISTVIWPPDMSGAKGGDVVMMSGNLWLKLSVDGGKTFTDLDFTKVFEEEKTYGGWAGDQVIHYIPAIDCFVLYVQSKHSGANPDKNVVKVALASSDDLKKHKGAKSAWWRQWDFTSDDFGLGNRWMDFPDLSYDQKFLYISTNTFTGKDFQGKLFFELPLAELKAGSGFNFQYALISEKINIGSPAQNISDENYWAAHVNNSTMRIYSSKGTDANYYWRDRTLSNWPRAPKDDNIVSAAPDTSDWISEDHRIIGATRVGNQVWFAWTADSGDGGAGGFKFPQPHIQIAKFDLSQDYKLSEQTQIWNPDHAFAYPSITTNSDDEVGISLAWGGGKYYGSHAVGILGDFVVWFGEASELTSARLSPDPTRWGDYVHVRLAHPDTRFFSAFGYAVLKDSTATPPEKGDYFYVEFGRDTLAPPPIR